MLGNRNRQKEATEYYKHVFLLPLNMEGGKGSTIDHIKLIVLSMLLRAIPLGLPPQFPKIIEMAISHLSGKTAIAHLSSKHYRISFCTK